MRLTSIRGNKWWREKEKEKEKGKRDRSDLEVLPYIFPFQRRGTRYSVSPGCASASVCFCVTVFACFVLTKGFSKKKKKVFYFFNFL